MAVAVIANEADAGADVFAARITEQGVPVHRINVGDRRYVQERKALREVLHIGRFDILHTHGYRADVVDGSVARTFGVRHVTTLHGFTGKGWKGRLYEWLQVRQARRADAAIAVSRSIAHRIDPKGKAQRLHVLPNAIGEPTVSISRSQAREALNIHPDRYAIGWIGRLSHEKGPDIAVDAMERYEGDACLVFIGDGPMRKSLELRAKALIDNGRVLFAGVRENARGFLSALDLLTLTSRTEGTPITLLEAMWAGTPIVATEVGGVPDVIDEHSAVLVPPEAAALATAWEIARSDSAATAQRAMRARSRAMAAHSMSAWLDEHVRLYEAILESAP